jgi:hypothetical protein
MERGSGRQDSTRGAVDAGQWADDPRYPGELVNLALRLGVNVAMYAMTH